VRTLHYLMAILMAVCAIAAYAWRERSAREHQALLSATHEAVHRIGQVVKYQATLEEVPLSPDGWPTTIDPAWFGKVPPHNCLLSRNRPWIEIASPKERHLLHPENCIAHDETVAAFWYNPGTGVVRARVPQTVSDRRALDMYNAVNGVELSSLFVTTAPSVVADATAHP